MSDLDPDFEEHRAMLERLAYRMLGSRPDADDVMQEAYMRWTRAERENVRSSQAFLHSIVTRLCIDRRREIETRKETYVGPWLPEPLVEMEPPADRAAEVAENVSLALMHVLERLTPVERAAYLLRQVFNFGYGEISDILEKTEANCRQIVSRAETRVHEGRPRIEADREEVSRLSEQFLHACSTGDLDGIVKLLTDDAVMVSDGGGKALAALRPIIGSDPIARFFHGIFKKTPEGTLFQRVLINGQPGFLVIIDGQPSHVMTFELDNGRIKEILIIRNPDKLARVYR
jgi:RNA polymerase sigma-70 factor (ECF subfamily)